MAGKKISYEVDVNASDAISEFKKVGKEAEKAGKAIEKGLEVTPDTGKIDKFITNLGRAKEEAENVAKAVGQVKKFAPTVDDSDIADMVLSLRKAGVEFDAIETKAKELGTTLNTLDSPKVRALDTSMRTASAGSDQLTRSVGGSRSVLANMVGNATQDLGALAGVAQSAGVAVGQMGEYMADARLEGEGMGSVFKNFAKVVGPVAALSVGIGLATAAVNAHKKAQQELEENVRQATEAFTEGVGSVDEWREAIEEAFEAGTVDDALAFSEQIASALESALEPKQFEDMQLALADLGLTFEDLGSLVQTAAPDFATFATNQLEAAGASEQVAGAVGLLVEEYGGAADILTDLNDRLDHGVVLLDQYGKEVPVDEALEFVEANKDMIDSLDEVEEGFNRVDVEKAADKFLKLESTISPAIRELVEFARVNQSLIGGTFGVPEDAIKSLEDYLVLQRTINAIQGTVVGTQEQYNEAVGAAEEAIDAAVAATEAEAVAAEEAKQKVLDLAEAMADLKDTIDTIDADDFSNIGSALQEALDLGDVPIDFQLVKENLRDGFDELGTFLEENPVDIDWAKVLDTSQDTGLSSELLGMIAGIRDQFQTGITEAFEIGGTGAAQHFVDSFIPQLAALGMSSTQIYEFLGLSPDGSVELFLKPLVDAEAKADALAILDSLMGVDPDNPILAYIRLGLQTGDIEPQIGEIAARLLAADALNVPAELEAFTQSDIDAAVAVLKGYGITVPVTVDDEGTIQDFTTAADEATVDRTTQVIVPKSDSLGAMQELIDHVARARTVAFNAKADNAGQINDLLDHLARAREAAIRVLLPNYATVEYDLQFLARDRHSNIILHTIGGSGGNTAGGNQVNTTLAPLLAPAALTATDEGTVAAAPLATAPAPMALSAAPLRVEVINQTPAAGPPITINAAVIGNRHEVDRVVTKALRRHQRVNGRRN